MPGLLRFLEISEAENPTEVGQTEVGVCGTLISAGIGQAPGGVEVPSEGLLSLSQQGSCILKGSLKTLEGLWWRFKLFSACCF